MASTIISGAAVEDRAGDSLPPMMTAGWSIRETFALEIAALGSQAT
jgi:hypothetical protein